jgi:hypothetical protein
MTMIIFMILKISIKSVLTIITKILCFQIKTVSHFIFYITKTYILNLHIKIIIQVLSLIT